MPSHLDHVWLREEYVTNKRSTTQIAADLGVSTGSVSYQLKRAGIQARGRWSGSWNPKMCATCGLTFTPSGPAAVYCSDRCRKGTGVCEECGTEYVRRSDTKAQRDGERFCSQACRVTNLNRNGRSTNAGGYVTIPRPATLSVRPTGDGYNRINLGAQRGRVLEHRHIMEQLLDRPLLPGENVHHLNGVRDDNRPENLELWIAKQPKGQRVEDVVAYALEMLTRYAPERLKT